MGKVGIVPFEIKNEYPFDMIYEIKIDDPDSSFYDSEYPEFNFIYSSIEWDFWCKHKGYPKNFNIRKIGSNFIELKANEKLLILFKFITFR